jgi:phage terminase large subunit-like protein
VAKFKYEPTRFMAATSRYCKAKADLAVAFVEALNHTDGEWYGRPFTLLPWQEQIVRDLFGIVDKKTGYRQFRTAYVEIPKKNGKSELASAIALFLLLMDGEPAAEIYSGAVNSKQASIVFETARRMIRQSPALTAALKVKPGYKRILHLPSESKYEVVSADAEGIHGVKPHGIIFDELHAVKSRDMFDNLTLYSGRARRQPLTFIITTAGHDLHSVCYEKHQYAEDLLAGRKADAAFYPCIFGAGVDEDWTSEDVWRKANPSLGVTFRLEDMRRDCAVAQQQPAEENRFRRLCLNQWTAQKTRWMPMAAWDACAGDVDADALAGRSCWAGLDLSSAEDVTALVLVFPPEDADATYRVLPFFWIPEERLEKKVRSDHVPYDLWRKRGYVFATPGNVVDYEYIKVKILELAKTYQIAELAADPWRFSEVSQYLEKAGFSMMEFRQDIKSMSQPTKNLLISVLRGELAHGGNPVLRWMMNNAVAIMDANDNVKLHKGKSYERIDGCIALIMALERARKAKKPLTPYAERGVRYI